MHKTEDQMKKEDCIVSLGTVLAIVTFMHNALIVIHNATPYQALYGRQPAILLPLEGVIGTRNLLACNHGPCRTQ